MRVLLDTHVWLWAHTQPQRLTSTHRDIIQDSSNEVMLSAASVWETAIKYRLGKLNLPSDPRSFLHKAEQLLPTSALQVTNEHALRVADLPDHHRDPFDRLLVAQAHCEGVPLLTVDRVFDMYDVEVIPATAQ